MSSIALMYRWAPVQGATGGHALRLATYALMHLTTRILPRTTVYKAKFSWRSPDRLSLWRTVSPLEAAMGAKPANLAKAASERSMPLWDHEEHLGGDNSPYSHPLYERWCGFGDKSSKLRPSSWASAWRGSTRRLAARSGHRGGVLFGPPHTGAASTSCPTGKWRKRARNLSGAVVTNACCGAIVLVLNSTTWDRVTTLIASRTPWARGCGHDSSERACRAARRVSISWTRRTCVSLGRALARGRVTLLSRRCLTRTVVANEASIKVSPPSSLGTGV